MGLCLALPWLNGLTAGPSPNFWPLWGAAVLGVAVLLQWRRVDARLLAQGWLAAALLSSVIGLLQYFGLVAGLAPWISASELGQAFGNLRQRNHFATLTSIGLVCLLALMALREPAHRRMAWARPWGFLAGSWLALGNAVSSSRTGFLQWVFILTVMLAAWAAWAVQGRGDGPRRSRPSVPSLVMPVLLWATGCYAAFVLALPHALLVWQHIEIGTMAQRLTDAGQDSRRLLWANVMHLIAQKPWLGWGWGELDYAHFITQYPGARFSELLDNAHNLPLQLAVELGLPFTLAVGFGLAMLVALARPWDEREPGRLLAWGVLAVIGVHSLLEYPLWYGPFHWTGLLCVLWLWRTRAGSAESAARTSIVPVGSTSMSPPGAPVLAGLCWSALAVLALDYARVSQLFLPVADRWPRHSLFLVPPIDSSGRSLFFQQQVDFARLTTTGVSSQNAGEMHELALNLLHYSPEPRVVEPLIASAVLMGRHDLAALYAARYRAAFSELAWAQLIARHPAWPPLLPN